MASVRTEDFSSLISNLVYLVESRRFDEGKVTVDREYLRQVHFLLWSSGLVEWGFEQKRLKVNGQRKIS